MGKRNDLTVVVCVFLLAVIVSLGVGYVLYMFRDATESKIIIMVTMAVLIYIVMLTARLGPFKHRK